MRPGPGNRSKIRENKGEVKCSQETVEPDIFLTKNAINFGVNEAVFIQFLMDELNSAYLLRQHGRGKAKFELVIEDGQLWMPWTLEDLAGELPFWSVPQIRRVIASCKKQGLIRTDNYNQNPWDRHLWYTVEGMNVNECQGN